MRYFSVFLFVLYFSALQAQDAPNVVRTSGEAQVEWLSSESRDEAEARAKETATVQALEKAFGTVIIQGNTTYVENVQTGQRVETHSHFNMIGETVVKGEVVEILREKYKDHTVTERRNNRRVEITYITCEITVRAKEITASRLDISTYALSKNERNFKTDHFFDYDDLFLFFQSPASGYVSVFLDDNTHAYRLLPYREMPGDYSGGFPVTADSAYIFFSTAPEHNYLPDDPYFVEDTYQLVAEKEVDINRLFVVFTKDPLDKPRLRPNLNEYILKEYEKGVYGLPNGLESEKFQRWLIDNQCLRSDIQIETLVITIEKQ